MTSGEQTDHFQTTAERDPNDYERGVRENTCRCICVVNVSLLLTKLFLIVYGNVRFESNTIVI